MMRQMPATTLVGSNLMAAAVELRSKVSAMTRLSPFEQAVMQFAGLLAGVPDCAAGELTDDHIDYRSRLAGDVTDLIELRIDQGKDSESTQLKLVSMIYQIRRSVEEMDTWRKHYHSPVDSTPR